MSINGGVCLVARMGPRVLSGMPSPSPGDRGHTEIARLHSALMHALATRSAPLRMPTYKEPAGGPATPSNSEIRPGTVTTRTKS